MNENVIKAIAIPVTAIAFLVAMRVMHKNPQLVASLMSQVSNAQQVPIDRKSLEMRASKCRNAIDITAIDDKALNELVWMCESKNKGLEKV